MQNKNVQSNINNYEYISLCNFVYIYIFLDIYFVMLIL